MPRLNKSTVDSASASGSDLFLWDDDLAGFGLRVKPSGVKSYLIQYRNSAGVSRRLTIGKHGVLTAEEARRQAKDKLAEVTKGADPAEAKREAREAATVADLVDLYLKEGPAEKPNKKASSWETDRSNINRHILPLLGRKIARLLTSADVARFQADVAAGKTAADIKTKKQGRAIVEGGKGTAARSLAVLGAILQFGVSRGVLPASPAKGVKLLKGEKRERFLSEMEVARLADALAAMETEGLNRNAAAAIRLLLLTGCRKDEILSLRWEYVDFERHCLRLPDSKTGAKVVPLAAAASMLLSKLPRKGKSSWVLPASGEANIHYTGLQKAWERVRERAAVMAAADAPDTPAGKLVAKLRKSRAAKSPAAQQLAESKRSAQRGADLPAFAECVSTAKSEGWEFPVGLADLRLHDLRHSFASFAVADGATLFMVGKVLGHKQARTTEVYAHLADDPVRAVADRAANRISAAMSGAAGGGEVIGIEEKRKA